MHPAPQVGKRTATGNAEAGPISERVSRFASSIAATTALARDRVCASSSSGSAWTTVSSRVPGVGPARATATLSTSPVSGARSIRAGVTTTIEVP